MTFASLDDIAAELSAGKQFMQPWFKLSGAAAHVAGNAYD